MFYKLNASRVTLREFWWETKLFAWVGLIVKLMRIRLRGSSDDLAVDTLNAFQVDQSPIRPEVLQRFAPVLQQLTALGFGQPVWHDQEDVYQATRNTLATALHSNGRAWVRVQCRTNFGRVPAKIKFFTTFISRKPGGFIATGNGKYDMAWPSTHDTVRFRMMPVDQVWKHHQNRMTPAVQPVSAAQLLDVAEEYHQSLRDFHLARGVFEPLGEEELALFEAPAAPLPVIAAIPSQPGDAAAAEVFPPPLPKPLPDLMEIATLDELRRLQNKKVNWRLSVVLLIASAALFVLHSRNSGDSGTQDWTFVAIIAGILLFHELGHYIAMKIFGYRNLKMFFIPGFGAAVSGRHYNAAAWKKIIVSLMGPLPGILAGIVFVALAGLLHNQSLYLIGLLAIIINAFNLLPVLPFDGGWVAHAALFSRHPKLDVGFRVVAAVLLVLIGLFVPGSHFLMYVAIASVVAIPIASRLAMIVGELRPVPGLGVSPDSQTIPPETARIILAKVRQRFKRGLNARLAAQHVASVFESLNARPPSAGATVGLLSLHAFGFVLALVVAVVAIGVKGLSGRQSQLSQQLNCSVTADQIAATPVGPTGARNVVVMRFKSDRAAADLFDSLPSTRPACRLGRSLLVSFAPHEIAEQRELFNRCEKTAEDRYVESSQMHSNVQMNFKLPDTDAGRQTFAELENCIGQNGWRLIPPWANDTDWPAAPRASQTQLRQLMKELQTPRLPDLKDRDRNMQIAAAQRSGDTEQVDRLQTQMKQNQKDAEQARDQVLQQKFGHADLIHTWEDINALTDWQLRSNRLKQEIAPQLGQWPAEKPNDLLATSGFAYREPAGGVNVYITFEHTDTGLPAMARWLFGNGASDVRYQIAGTAAMPDVSNDDPN